MRVAIAIFLLSFFSLLTIDANAARNDYILDSDMAQAQRVILSTYGDSVSIGKKAKNLLKFGRATNIGSSSRGTVWVTNADQQNETYVADNVNSIDSISSSSAGDNQEVVVEGHTMSGNDRTFVTQTVTLQGRTRVALTTALNRATRLYNNNGTSITGPVFVYENTSLTSGKPTNTAKIHITMASGEQQSEKASTSLSSQDYWIITGIRCDQLEKSATVFSDLRLEIRARGKVFRPGVIRFRPYVIAPKNADIRLTAISSASATEISGSIDGYLAIIE